MGLFGFGKKKEEEKVPCSCGGMCTPSEIAAKEAAAKGATKEVGANVKILGGGCAKCNELEAATVAALAELGMDTTIEHVTDFSVIATYGVMSTPALVVSEKVISYGKVLKKEEVMKLLKNI